MAEISLVNPIEVVDIELKTPRLQLPNMASTVEDALSQALEFCAQKMSLGSRQAVLEHLRQGDNSACTYCKYSLAKQVAAMLGSLDENIKSVYICDYDATPEDLCFGQTAQTSLIHIIVWTQRKTVALNSLVEALDRALAQSYADLTGMDQLTHLLDVQAVDDADVQNGTGYGAMFSSIHHRPIQIWKR